MITVIAITFGLIFGSFINALIWRLHKKKNWVRERSVCIHCGHTLAPLDLIPVFSWLYLGGKCRYCKKPIDDNPIVEISTGILFALSYAYWPGQFNFTGIVAFGAWLACLVGLIALTAYDIRWMLLPNRLVAYTTVTAVLTIILSSFSSEKLSIVITSIAGAAIIFSFFWVLFQLSDGKWIGGGDVKLSVALGLLAGSPLKAILVIFLASILGSLVSVPALASKKLRANSKIAFGPFLILATIIVFLWGERIIDWYTHAILYM